MSYSIGFDIFARDRASDTFKHVGDNAHAAGDKVSKIGSGFALAGKAVGIAAVGIGAGLLYAAKTGLTTASSMEQAGVAFTTLLGSGQKSQQFLGQLQQFAAATPFEFPGLVDASRQLLGVGVASKDIIPTLTAFGDASGALGLTQDNFNHVMLATSQAISAGKFQAGDLNQITQAGIPVWKILSESMHKPVTAIRTLSSQGKLLASDVMPLLKSQMEKDYGGAMAKQSQTLGGIWSTLMDTFSMGLANVLVPLLPALKSLASVGIVVLGKAFTWLGAAAKNVIGWLTANWPQIEHVISVGWSYVRPVLASFATYTGIVIRALSTAVAYVIAHWPQIEQALITAWNNIKPTLIAFQGMVITLWKQALHPMVTWFVTHWPQIQAVAKVVLIGFAIALKVLLVALQYAFKVIGFLITVFATSWRITFAVAGAVVRTAMAVIKKVVDGASGIFNGIKTAASGAIDWVSKRFNDAVGFFRKLPGRVSGLFSGMFDGIKSAFSSALNWVIGKWNGLQFTIPGVDTHIPGVGKVGGFTLGTPDIPLLARGSFYASAGRTLVGENGPEIVDMPVGSRVFSNKESRAMASQAAGGESSRPLVVNLTLDGTVIHQALLKVKRGKGGLELGLA